MFQIMVYRLRYLFVLFCTFSVIFLDLSCVSFASDSTDNSWHVIEEKVGRVVATLDDFHVSGSSNIFNTSKVSLKPSYNQPANVESVYSYNDYRITRRTSTSASGLSYVNFTVTKGGTLVDVYSVPLSSYTSSNNLFYFSFDVPITLDKRKINWNNIYDSGTSLLADMNYNMLFKIPKVTLPSSVLSSEVSLIDLTGLFTEDFVFSSFTNNRYNFRTPPIHGFTLNNRLATSNYLKFNVHYSGVIDSSDEIINIPYDFNIQWSLSEDFRVTGYDTYDSSLNDKFEDFSNSFNDRFVPDDGSNSSSSGEASGADNVFGSAFTELQDKVNSKLGFLSFPVNFLLTILNGLSSEGTEFIGITFPELKWDEYVLIPETVVTFPDIGIQDTLYFVTDIILVGWFLVQLQDKLRDFLRS